jgi:predicted metal-binding protein
MSDPIRARPTPWNTVILLCGKCARKMDGGYGAKGKETLRTILTGAVWEKGRRRDVRIVETRCLGICPKKAVTALNAGRPGTILTIPKGTSANEAMELLVNQMEKDGR